MPKLILLGNGELFPHSKSVTIEFNVLIYLFGTKKFCKFKFIHYLTKILDKELTSCNSSNLYLLLYSSSTNSFF